MEILYNYRKQPQCEPQVCLSVFVGWSSTRRNGAYKQRTRQKHVGITTFYNEIFIPSVEPLLFELGPCGATLKSDQITEVNNKNDGHLAQCPGSTKTPTIPCGKKVSATQCICLSVKII